MTAQLSFATDARHLRTSLKREFAGQALTTAAKEQVNYSTAFNEFCRMAPISKVRSRRVRATSRSQFRFWMKDDLKSRGSARLLARVHLRGLRMRHDELKAKQRHLRGGFPQDLGLRVHRAISWIGRAEKETQDNDATFIFLWIAFNAAYADDGEAAPDRSLGDRRQFVELIDKLVALDAEARLYSVVWDRFRGPIAKLMENQFVYRPFWLNQNGIDGNHDWARRFRSSAERFVRAMADRDTAYVLRQVFDRLYMLRCQMMHGGATWNGKVNRQQVKDAADIMRSVMPVIVDIMMDNPEEDWGQPFYPVATIPITRSTFRSDRI